ncbi:unnamed protein product [Lactuca saligna]|uniref:Uncharacterized protein n=1 Tax=Lactuca saligna TaxID=75948 RepID=A0AA35ZF66_LACSI|nr:unnamed protein product [Lactuca saligna]
MIDEHKCKEYLNWVRWGDQVDSHEQRVAWTIAPFEYIPHRKDLSHANIGLITSRRTQINDEIHAAFEGKVYKLGIIEFNEDWFPFRFDPLEDGKGKMAVDDETSAKNDEREKGEIWPETDELDDQEPGKTRVLASEPTRMETEVEEPHCEAVVLTKASREGIETTPRNTKQLTPNGMMVQPSHVNDACQTNPSTPKSLQDGLSIGLPPLRCFGPFPSPTTCNEAHTFKVGRSNGKRRRVINIAPSVSPMFELIGADPMPQTVPLSESPSTPTEENQFDLNTPPIQQSEITDRYPQNPPTI